jgi:H+/gluconate symporter-like permease
MIVFGQVILTNSLREKVAEYAPAIDPELVIVAGSTAIRRLVSGDALAGVLLAYSVSLDRLFYLCAGISVAGLFFSCFMTGSVTRTKGDDPGVLVAV